MVSANTLQLMATPCRDVTSWNLTDKCEFVRMAPSCQPNMGYVNYLQLMYCMLGPENVTYTVGLSVVWLLLLFVALGVTSGDFLTPALFVISKTLHMSQNVAGVTLLAFGNGSPDIFASLAGIRQGSYEMVIGGLIGGGIFVTTVVAGSIFLTHPFKMAGRPFLRDCFFYTTAASWTFYSFYTGSISMTSAIGFICLYAAYIVLVVVSGFIYQRFLNNEKKEADSDEPTDCKKEKLDKGSSVVTVKRVFKKRRAPVFDDPERNYVVPIAFRYLHAAEEPTPAEEANNNDEAPDLEEGVYYINLGMDSREEEVDVDTLAITVDSPRRGSNLEKLHLQKIAQQQKKSPPSPAKEFLGKVVGVGLDDWLQQPMSIRLMCLFKSPIYFVLAITTPVVDVVKPKNNWCRPLNCFHCVTAPVFVCFAFGYGLEMIAGVVPIFAVLAAAGSIFGLVVFFTSKDEEPPKYHWAFAYVGFLIGVVWIYVISMEIVVLLQSVGIVFNISDAILGLTILAWGNGLLDFLANLNIARKGFPRMGIAACFGTPCLTLLLGVGIPTLIQLAGTGNVLVLKYSKIITVLFAALAVSLLSSTITNVALRFNTKRFYGAYLLALYFTFLVVAVLVESGFL